MALPRRWEEMHYDDLYVAERDHPVIRLKRYAADAAERVQDEGIMFVRDDGAAIFHGDANLFITFYHKEPNGASGPIHICMAVGPWSEIRPYWDTHIQDSRLPVRRMHINRERDMAIFITSFDPEEDCAADIVSRFVEVFDVVAEALRMIRQCFSF